MMQHLGLVTIETIQKLLKNGLFYLFDTVLRTLGTKYISIRLD